MVILLLMGLWQYVNSVWSLLLNAPGLPKMKCICEIVSEPWTSPLPSEMKPEVDSPYP